MLNESEKLIKCEKIIFSLALFNLAIFSIIGGLYLPFCVPNKSVDCSGNAMEYFFLATILEVISFIVIVYLIRKYRQINFKKTNTVALLTILSPLFSEAFPLHLVLAALLIYFYARESKQYKNQQLQTNA